MIKQYKMTSETDYRASGIPGRDHGVLMINRDTNGNEYACGIFETVTPDMTDITDEDVLQQVTEIYNELNKVPEVVSMRQARLALHKQGLLVSVSAAIEASSDEELKIEWEYATTIERNFPSLGTLVASLGMSSQDLDNLFRLAATI